MSKHKWMMTLMMTVGRPSVTATGINLLVKMSSFPSSNRGRLGVLCFYTPWRMPQRKA